MEKFFLVIFFILSGFIYPVFSEEKQEVVILGTTDIHGHLLPIDYFTGNSTKNSLANISTYINEVRSDYKNVILVDSGDLLQGNPISYYYGKIDQKSPSPIIRAMNNMKYDAFAIGNHEYDYGLNRLIQVENQAKFKFLSANTYLYSHNTPAFEPYIIKNMSGIKVGIIGFTTPGVSIWSKNIVDKKLVFKDIIKSAELSLSELKKSNPDIIIAIAHSGIAQNSSNSLLAENIGLELAESFPELTAILLGHTHKIISEKVVNGVLITQAGKHSEGISQINISLSKEKNDDWKVFSKKSKYVPTKDFRPDKKITELFKNESKVVFDYLRKPIATTNESFSAKGARIKDKAIIDLINKVQLEATGADLSVAQLFKDDLEIKKGNITIANLSKLYPYENTLVAIELNGKQLKDYLEYSAKYFKGYKDDKVLINKNVPGYNYDIISGVDYKIDLSKPVGSRIVYLKYNGKFVNNSMKFTMAMNNYRQSGGGNYSMISNCRVVYNKYENIRDLIFDYVSNHKILQKKDFWQKNWEIVGIKNEEQE